MHELNEERKYENQERKFEIQELSSYVENQERQIKVKTPIAYILIRNFRKLNKMLMRLMRTFILWTTNSLMA